MASGFLSDEVYLWHIIDDASRTTIVIYILFEIESNCPRYEKLSLRKRKKKELWLRQSIRHYV